MRKLLLTFFLLSLPSLGAAEVSLAPLLNKVTLRLHSENWVTTKTALVDVSINATVTGQGIEKIQADVMQKLNQISPGDWHIVSFDRQQDKSGLESVQITAQARLPQANLANLREKAKTLTKPGETYSINDVQFTPSEEELKQANISLRNNIYQQAKLEIDALNAQYTDQKFYLHQIDFNSGPILRNGYAKMQMVGAAAAPAPESPAPPLAVGNKQELDAYVVLAAMPAVLAQKLTNATTTP